MDHIFIVWTHGKELQGFLQHHVHHAVKAEQGTVFLRHPDEHRTIQLKVTILYRGNTHIRRPSDIKHSNHVMCVPVPEQSSET
jgi:hypothetical protein